MTDLTLVMAATIDPNTSLAGAEQPMIHQGVRLLFAVTEYPCVEGLVTSGDLLDDRPVRWPATATRRARRLCGSMQPVTSATPVAHSAYALGTGRALRQLNVSPCAADPR